MTAQSSGKSYADATRIKGELFIECVGVDKFFGDFQALNNVDINVGFREVVVVDRALRLWQIDPDPMHQPIGKARPGSDRGGRNRALR